MSRRLSVREKWLFLIVIIIGILYIYTNFYFLPTALKAKEIKLFLKKESDVNSIYKDNQYSFDDKKLSVKLSEMIPNIERNSQIAYNIKIMTERSETKLKKLSFEDVTNSGNRLNFLKKYSNRSIFAIPVKIVIIGEYLKVVKLLKLLEEDVRLCGISNIIINNSELNLTETNIELSYYYFGGGE